MIRSLIIFVVVILGATIGLGIYLQPNDLASCGIKPGVDVGCQSVDAIVAISGGDTEARAEEAIDLYKNGWSSIVIFSGAAQDKTGPSNAAAMKKIAISAGVPDSVILVEESSNTTKENAQNLQKIFSEREIKDVILVTSGYHQRRASLELNKYTENVVVINHSTENDKNWSTWWWTTPYGWWLAVNESVKIIVFYSVGT